MIFLSRSVSSIVPITSALRRKRGRRFVVLAIASFYHKRPMIVRAEDFEYRPSSLIADPNAPQDLKNFFKESGMAEPYNNVDCLELVDECFKCGEKLTTPFVYWNGGTGSLSMHPYCAADLAHGLAQDAFAVSKGRRPDSGREAVKWLDLFAAKKEYRVEDEEFPGDPAAKPYRELM